MGELYSFKNHVSNKSSDDHLVTDVENAERFIRAHGDNFLYCKGKGWLVFDGQRWIQDEKDSVIEAAKQTAKQIREEVNDVEFDQLRSLLATHAIRSQSKRAIDAMVSLARPKLTVSAKALDQNPWLLNVTNGTIDLRNGTLQPHDRFNLITKLAPVVYDPEASYPLWFRFLERVQPDAEVRAFLQRLAGYSLTGVIAEHVLPINYGTGRNGKSVYVDTLLHIWGDYARQVPTELLMEKRGDAHPTERTVLLGCRFASNRAYRASGLSLCICIRNRARAGTKYLSGQTAHRRGQNQRTLHATRLLRV